MVYVSKDRFLIFFFFMKINVILLSEDRHVTYGSNDQHGILFPSDDHIPTLQLDSPGQ